VCGVDVGASDERVREVTDIGATEYTVTGLRAHTPYVFRVIAANGLGRGTPSGPLLVTTAQHGQPVCLHTRRQPFSLLNFSSGSC